MATQGIMKTEHVPVSSKKVEITSTVHEITEKKNSSSYSVTKPLELDPRVICRLPPAPKIEDKFKPEILKEFKCAYPSVDPNVERVRLPLPFPDTLEETIGWADAFIDRVASETRARKEKNLKDLRLLADRIYKLEDQLDTTQVDLAKSREETTCARNENENKQKKIDALLTELVEEKAIVDARNQTIAEQKSTIARLEASEAALQIENFKVKKERDAAKKAGELLVQELHKHDADAAAALKEEHKKHLEDHTELENEHKLLLAEINAKKDAQCQLATVREELRQAQIKIKAKDMNIKDLEGRLEVIHANLHKTLEKNKVLRKEKEALQKQFDGATHNLREAVKDKTRLEKELETAQKSICSLDKELKEAQLSSTQLQGQVTTLLKEKEAVETSLKKLEQDIAHAEAALKKANEDSAAERSRYETEWTTKYNEALAKYEHANEEKDNWKKEYDVAFAGFEHAVGEKDKANSERNEKQKQLDAAEAELKRERETQEEQLQVYKRASKEVKIEDYLKLKKDLEATQKKLIPQTPGKRVTILTVEYGGKAYTADKYPAFFKSLQETAEQGKSFKVENNHFPEGDPFPKHCKSFSITYQLDGEGHPIHLYGREHGNAEFKLTRQ